MKPLFNSKENTLHIIDGKEVWESRSVVVAAIIIMMDKNNNLFVLAEKRSNKMLNGQNLWCVPSGYINFNEDGWDAMRRELYEETSFLINKYKNEIVFDNNREPFFIITNPNDNNKQDIILLYCVILDFSQKEFPKKVEEYKCKEVDEVKWIRIDKISSYEWAFNHNYRILEAIEKLTPLSNNKYTYK